MLLITPLTYRHAPPTYDFDAYAIFDLVEYASQLPRSPSRGRAAAAEIYNSLN